MVISKGHGGSGTAQCSWTLCDAPLLLYSLVRLGYGRDERIGAGIDHLVSLVRPNGWPCAVSANLGRFRGPGRKDDPCPYSNLLMLKLLALLPQYRDGRAAHAGAEAALELWTNSRTRHPYMFYMGTDFRKLKLPFVWYDVLHLAEVLTQFTWLRGDERLMDMVGVIASKRDAIGRFAPESVWQPWKDWEFGNKGQASRSLTLVASRIIRRMGMEDI